jgi:hypothetical protein
MVWILLNNQGVCERCPTLQDKESSSNPNSEIVDEIIIQGSVGIHGYNYRDDVITIQKALNRVPDNEGGAKPKLKIDGKCEKNTIKAIQIFQLKHFGWRGADGLIEIAKQTLARLNAVLDTKKGYRPTIQIVESIAIQMALGMVMAARNNILMAGPVIDKKQTLPGVYTVFNRDSLMRLLNKHFSIDSSTNPLHAYSYVKYIFGLIWQVFQRPGGLWGVHMFERDPLALKKTRAYALAGGYHLPGQHKLEKGVKLRTDSIYLCKRFFEEKPLDKQAFIIIHECAHFVDRHGKITDHAKNDGGGAKIRGLPPFQKRTNANCYSNFAFEARTGKEPWHIT